jgi:hypothetical protein
MSAPLVISLPAWGADFVDLATRYVAPAAKLAIERGARVNRRDVLFIVHTDAPERFAEPLRDFEAHFYALPRLANRYQILSECHRQVMAAAPHGAAIMLLNADIVSSIEAIEFAEHCFAAGRKAVVTVAMRARSDALDVPIGAGARDMLEWFWRNRHPIATDCLWGTGRTNLPTNLFFESGGNVVLHCFHSYPIVLIKDRALSFRQTIDDDLLAVFRENECAFATERECAFLELSSPTKEFGSGDPLSVQKMMTHGRYFQQRHVDLFRRQIRITGDEDVPGSAALVAQIAAGLASRRGRFRR